VVSNATIEEATRRLYFVFPNLIGTINLLLIIKKMGTKRPQEFSVNIAIEFESELHLLYL
jgi:hypothetical protein